MALIFFAILFKHIHHLPCKFVFLKILQINTKEIYRRHTVCLKDIADIQNGVSTNCDSAYIFAFYTDKEMTMPYMGKHTDLSKTVYFRHPVTGQATEIESSILRRCVKESKFIGKIDNIYIIYPYENGCQISEDSLKKEYPKAYAYLLTIKNKLLERNMDKEG